MEDDILVAPPAQNQARSAGLISDEVLMERIAGGDSDALAQLYDRYARSVYGLALRILNGAEQAEDIVQETFWRVWKRSATFRSHHGQVAPWLFGITRNLCIDELRRRQSRPSTVNDTPDASFINELPDTNSDIELQSWEAERRKLIVDALSELPLDQRQVIELAYFGGLSQREIATHLESPLGTVKTRIRLALQKLKGSLLQLGFTHEDH